MPELPEVETIRRGIASRIGVPVTSVDVRRADVIAGLPPKSEDAERALLAGSAVARLHRRGKQLALEGTCGRVVLVQLGMSGQLCSQRDEGQFQSHTHVVWRFRDGKRMIFRDPRRFGGLTLLDSVASLESHWSDLGPDALEIDAKHLVEACQGSRRTIKAVLLDQRVLAGVGNIYADEALFLAGMRPSRSAHRFSKVDLGELAPAVRAVLAEGVKARGSTLRDYVDADGARGGAQNGHRVYGRGGKPCVQCGTTLRKASVAQRTTVYCPVCQR